MYLINTKSLELEYFVDPPPYAILSHTWHDGEEVLHKDFIGDYVRARRKKGYRKVDYLCQQAVQAQLRYAWIDTVCIDKTSSAELSEAINSMYQWYREAHVCYVYLDDVDQASQIPGCRWLTRGWTLQELLAPRNVYFYNRDWNFIGSKASLIAELTLYTNIDQIALTDPMTISVHSAATRMSWAANRTTTRVEDMAYCLLGLFEVNMPLLYGEREKAFKRLQEQILIQHHDITILAFNRDRFHPKVLARSPHVFGRMPKIVAEPGDYPTCESTDSGLKLALRVSPPPGYLNSLDIVLGCRFEFNVTDLIAIRVRSRVETLGTGHRQVIFAADTHLVSIPREACSELHYHKLLLQDDLAITNLQSEIRQNRFICSLRANEITANGYMVMYAVPQDGSNSWSAETLVSEVVSSADSLLRKFAFVHLAFIEAFVLVFLVQHKSAHRTWAERIWLYAEAKPPQLPTEIWLHELGMYNDANRGARITTEAELIEMCDGRATNPASSAVVSGKRFSPPMETTLSLQSGRSFSRITLRITEGPIDSWIIEISPG